MLILLACITSTFPFLLLVNARLCPIPSPTVFTCTVYMYVNTRTSLKMPHASSQTKTVPPSPRELAPSSLGSSAMISNLSSNKLTSSSR